MKPIIALTVGDCNGIGPEVLLKSLHRREIRKACHPVLIGPRNVFLHYARLLRVPFEPTLVAAGDPLPPHTRSLVLVESSPLSLREITPGRISAVAGRTAALAIVQAVRMALTGQVDAIVTAPVSKRGLHRAGFAWPGQTEMLQALSSSRHVAMMLVSQTLRVGLATIHLPLNAVAASLSFRNLKERILVIHQALVRDWNIRKPRLAILGLNPHAGEGGDLGKEERRVIVPVIRSCRASGILLDGPFPADSFFARYRPGTYDAVVAMYHDQGLIPLKMSSFGGAVNVSVGLRIIRTSPDHGTAFDIAGKGVADPNSMVEAIKLAASLAKNHRYPTGRRPR